MKLKKSKLTSTLIKCTTAIALAGVAGGAFAATIGSVTVPDTLQELAVEPPSTINPQFDNSLKNFQDATRYNDMDLFNSEDKTRDLLELAAFLANTSHETGHAYQGSGSYNYTSELNCSDGKGITNPDAKAECTYTDINWPCTGVNCTWEAKKNGEVKSKIWMYGRGALQLSWNGNYEQFSKTNPGHDFDSENDPSSLILGDGSSTSIVSPLIWSSATWFWGTPWGPSPKFKGAGDSTTYLQNDPVGGSIKSINQAYECGQAPVGKNEALDRIYLFNKYAHKLAKLNDVDLSAYTQDKTPDGKLYAGWTCLTGGQTPAPTGIPKKLCKQFASGCATTCGGGLDSYEDQTYGDDKCTVKNDQSGHNMCSDGGKLWKPSTGLLYIKCKDPTPPAPGDATADWEVINHLKVGYVCNDVSLAPLDNGTILSAAKLKCLDGDTTLFSCTAPPAKSSDKPTCQSTITPKIQLGIEIDKSRSYKITAAPVAPSKAHRY
jgi:predicted chitinase